MIDTMIMGGNIALLGLPPKPFATDWGKIVLKALTMRGIYGRQMYDTWYKMLAMLDNGLEMSGMITHRFACDQYQEAFDVMLTGECGKVVLDWQQGAT
jgi:threonine 3-dehydrogenase